MGKRTEPVGRREGLSILRALAGSNEPPDLLFEPCALCAENGIRTAAVDDVPTPSGMWANVCAAHKYRVESEARANTRLLLAFRAPADDREAVS